MKRDDNTITHESYGLIGISRYTGGDDVLFGSSIKHRNGISLHISTAEHTRDLSHDWYYARKKLIEVNMSPSQFAELITTPNVGMGVPCTIRQFNGQGMENPPFEHRAETFRQEFQERVDKVADGGTLYMKEALDLLESKPTITKGDRETIKNALRMLMQEVRSNLPFVQKQFQEQMDKTVAEAKAEVEAFVEHKVRSLGLEAIKEQTPLLPE